MCKRNNARYWVLRISDKASGRTAFIGFGFRDRDTATELRSAVQDSLRFLDREREAKRLQALDAFDSDDPEVSSGTSAADDSGQANSRGGANAASASKLRLAEGQTLTLVMAGVTPERERARRSSAPKASSDAAAFASLALPPAPRPAAGKSSSSSSNNNNDDNDNNNNTNNNNNTRPPQQHGEGEDVDWGEFTAAAAAVEKTGEMAGRNEPDHTYERINQGAAAAAAAVVAVSAVAASADAGRPAVIGPEMPTVVVRRETNRQVPASEPEPPYWRADTAVAESSSSSSSSNSNSAEF